MDDDQPLQDTLLNRIRISRQDIKELLDNVCNVMQQLRSVDLITGEEHMAFLERYHRFLGKMSLIEVAFHASPPDMAKWCAKHLLALGDELAKYIDGIELFNDTIVVERIMEKYPLSVPAVPVKF